MGLFSKPDSHDADFVIQTVRFFGISGAEKRYEGQVKRFFNEHNGDRIETLAAAAASIPNPKTQKELYAVSSAYVCAGARYRKEAIAYLLKYIQAGGVWDGVPSGVVVLSDGVRFDQRKRSVSAAYMNLGIAYEGEHMLDEAESSYRAAASIEPAMLSRYMKIATVLAKMGRFDDGVSALEDGMKYLTKEDKKIASEKVAELQRMKANGYVYKPRKGEK